MGQKTVGLFFLPLLAAALIFWSGEMKAMALEETEFWELWITEETEFVEFEEPETKRHTEIILPETELQFETESFYETEEAAISAVYASAELDERFIQVSWKDKDSGLCLIQGEDDENIRAISEGVWELEFKICTLTGDGLAQNGNILLNGSYTYPLVLPAGQLEFGQIEGQDSRAYLSWTLAQSSGVLTITLSLPSELSEEFDFRQSVVVSKADEEIIESEEPLEAQILKAGFFDPILMELNWSVCAVIPSYAGSCRSWDVYDYEGYNERQFGALGDLLVESVSLSSAGYQGPVPQLDQAGNEDLFAWQLIDSGFGDHSSISKITLGLYYRCSCSAANGCNAWEKETQSCGSKVGDGNFCSCWQYPYNAELNILYRADARNVIQKLEDKSNDQTWVKIQNNAVLEEDGDWAGADESAVNLKKILTKTESAAPSLRDDSAGSYKITFNPNHFAYNEADCITVTDRMQNLAHLSTGTVSAVLETGEALTLIDETEALALRRSSETENRFYSVRVENCMENGKIGEILTIQLWFPTDLSCSIFYDAMIINPDLTGDSGMVEYKNTAGIGGIEVSLSGSIPAYTDADILSRRRLILTKHDAADEDIVLPGAEFEVFFYQGDLSGEKKDIRLATLVTDEEGKGVFCSAPDAEDGAYLIQTDQLYYLKELCAPEGYETDEKLYWFYWKKNGIAPENLPEGEDLLICDPDGGDGAGEILLRVPNRKQEIPGGPELPATGGPGVRLYLAAALLFLAAVSALSLSLLQLRDLLCRWYTYKLKQSVLSRQNG